MKPEVLEMNEEVCGGVRTLQITAKRGLDAEEGGFDDSTLCPSGIYTCCRCEPQPRGCVATASWGAPAMSMPGCIPVWGLLPAPPPPSLALSASLSLCQDLSLVSRPSAGCFATKKVSSSM